MENMINACNTREELENLLNKDDIGTYAQYGCYHSVRILALKRMEQIALSATPAEGGKE